MRTLAITTAVLLLAGVGGAVAVNGDGTNVGAGGTGGPTGPAPRGQVIQVSPDAAPPDLAGVPGEIADGLPELMRFVEKARGLDFKTPVDVELLSDDDFRRRLLETDEDDEEDREELRTTGRVLTALGLLDDDVDLGKEVDKLLGDAVVGFYDTEEDDLVVRGDSFSPYVKSTFVHELTHALQDQHFDLDREDIDDRDDEASTAFSSVIEGDAVRIEEMYGASLPEAEQKEMEREEAALGGGIDPDIPRVLFELIGFPYIFGPILANQLVEKGGQARLDTAFREPPSTSEQVMHPDLYLADGEVPLEVEDPKPAGKEIDAGVVGEFGLLLVLNKLMETPEAFRAVRGWGGDRYVAWNEGERTCVRMHVVMDTARDTTELREALAEGSRESGGRLRVSADDDVVVVTSCA